MIKMLNGLVNYFGGKRKIVKLIASLVKGESFCDLFLGGGSVGLYMKAQGFQVYSCDRSYLSYLVAKSFLENNQRQIHPDELKRIMLGRNSNTYCYDHFYPDLFTERHARFIDHCIGEIEKLRSESSKCLLRMMIAKFIFKLRAFGSFSNLEYMQAYNFKDEEEILHRNPAYYKNQEKTCFELAEECRKEVNESVFTNGKVNYFYYGDVFDFAYRLKCDTVYLDPPYYGSQTYENYYSIVNKILTAGGWRDHGDTKFNTKASYMDSIDRIVAYCNNIPRLIFSYGGYKGIEDRDAIIELVKTHRGGNYEVMDLPYSYSIHRTNGNGENAKELLIVSDLRP